MATYHKVSMAFNKENTMSKMCTLQVYFLLVSQTILQKQEGAIDPHRE